VLQLTDMICEMSHSSQRIRAGNSRCVHSGQYRNRHHLLSRLQRQGLAVFLPSCFQAQGPVRDRCFQTQQHKRHDFNLRINYSSDHPLSCILVPKVPSLSNVLALDCFHKNLLYAHLVINRNSIGQNSWCQHFMLADEVHGCHLAGSSTPLVRCQGMRGLSNDSSPIKRGNCKGVLRQSSYIVTIDAMFDSFRLITLAANAFQCLHIEFLV